MNYKLIFELFLCVLYASLNVLGTVTIKSALTGKTLNSVQDYFWFLLYWKTILGLFFVFTSALVVFKALSVAKMTYILPLSTGINFLLIFLIGTFIFKEEQNMYSFLGAGFVIVGIFLLSIKS
jgi:multidrug transporter EmrE-like cation transporter